ncbi:basic proline-rich protein-like [Camarhynchus parvulus]|uniref:basic proline-rich protein-like n=1 Tax=Geospiza parvula TaxID=87175 RepID=UPI001237FE01|nr:basic proline-rich protein-like [Camarhynchus parvulus]
MERPGFRESPFLPPSRSRSRGSCHHLAFVEGASELPAAVPPPPRPWAAVTRDNLGLPELRKVTLLPLPPSARLARTPAGLIITARTTSTAGRAPAAPPAPSPAPRGRRTRAPAPLCPRPQPGFPGPPSVRPAPPRGPPSAPPVPAVPPLPPHRRLPLRPSPAGPPPRRGSRRPRLGLPPCPAVTPRPPPPSPARGCQPRALPPPPARRPTWERRKPRSFAAGSAPSLRRGWDSGREEAEAAPPPPGPGSLRSALPSARGSRGALRAPRAPAARPPIGRRPFQPARQPFSDWPASLGGGATAGPAAPPNERAGRAGGRGRAPGSANGGAGAAESRVPGAALRERPRPCCRGWRSGRAGLGSAPQRAAAALCALKPPHSRRLVRTQAHSHPRSSPCFFLYKLAVRL